MKKQKACKDCKTVFEGDKCPNCGSANFSDSFKGRVIITDPEKSEIAEKIKINKKGVYAIRI